MLVKDGMELLIFTHMTLICLSIFSNSYWPCCHNLKGEDYNQRRKVHKIHDFLLYVNIVNWIMRKLFNFLRNLNSSVSSKYDRFTFLSVSLCNNFSTIEAPYLSFRYRESCLDHCLAITTMHKIIINYLRCESQGKYSHVSGQILKLNYKYLISYSATNLIGMNHTTKYVLFFFLCSFEM